jgi:glycosyltransferase involved in cell wall biosynthesis
MRIVYLTIDNVNDNVILAQTLPLLGRLATFPGMERTTMFALRKGNGSQYRSAVPSGVTVQVAQNHGIRHPLTAFNLARFAWLAWREAKPGTVLIGRNPVSLLCLAPAACRARTRLVLDYRGILSEEFVLQGKVRARGRLHRMLRGVERWALRRADGILCVSRHLRRRIRGWQPAAALRAVIVPCCVDPTLTSIDEGGIARVRAEMGWSPDQFVLAYAGSLSAWNRPDAIRDVYHGFRAVEGGTRLLLLTGDPEKARAIFGAEEGVAVRSLPHGEVPRYLAAADLGLLLREPNGVNRVASPVKFAEYLWCGLPVLVSAGVGDCSHLVRRSGVGFVAEDGLAPSRVIAEVRATRVELRERCQAVARAVYTAERYQPALRWLLTGASAGAEPAGPRMESSPGGAGDAP